MRVDEVQGPIKPDIVSKDLRGHHGVHVRQVALFRSHRILALCLSS